MADAYLRGTLGWRRSTTRSTVTAPTSTPTAALASTSSGPVPSSTSAAAPARSRAGWRTAAPTWSARRPRRPPRSTSLGGKPDAERVRWIVGDATRPCRDRRGSIFATMTGNVAQVFLTDDEWASTLASRVRRPCDPAGWLVVRGPGPGTRRVAGVDPRAVVPAGPSAATSAPVRDVDRADDGGVATRLVPLVVRVRGRRREAATPIRRLRFRPAPRARGLAPPAPASSCDDVRDAPDRPGRELVLLARTPPARSPAVSAGADPGAAPVL